MTSATTPQTALWPDRWTTDVGRLLEPIYNIVQRAVEQAPSESAEMAAKAIRYSLDAIVEMLDVVEPLLKDRLPLEEV